jgi:hypothetical protein
MDAANAIMHGTLMHVHGLGLGRFGFGQPSGAHEIDLIDPPIVAALVWPADAVV